MADNSCPKDRNYSCGWKEERPWWGDLSGCTFTLQECPFKKVGSFQLVLGEGDRNAHQDRPG